MSDNKKTDSKKIAAICLGVVVVIMAAGLAATAIITRPAELSEVKMQENMAAAKEAVDAAQNETEWAKDDAAEESNRTELPAFEVAASGTSGLSNNKKTTEDSDEEDAAVDIEDIEDIEDEDNSEYLCSYSAERIMTEEDVEAIKGETFDNLPSGKGNIQMVINEMYAKHGYQFENQEIQEYFEQKVWYQNINTRNTDMRAVFQSMSDVEKRNVEFLNEHNGEEG